MKTFPGKCLNLKCQMLFMVIGVVVEKLKRDGRVSKVEGSCWLLSDKDLVTIYPNQSSSRSSHSYKTRIMKKKNEFIPETIKQYGNIQNVEIKLWNIKNVKEGENCMVIEKTCSDRGTIG